MGILATCPECQATFRVREHLRGKRIRCRSCRAPVLVGADEVYEPGVPLSSSGIATSTDIEVWDETQHELPLRRLKTASNDVGRGPSLFQRAMFRTAESAGVGLGIVFFGFWLPFSLLEPKFILILNLVIGPLCLIGAVTGLVLERLRISFDNPIDAVHRGTIGGLASRLVSSGEVEPFQNRRLVGKGKRDGRRLAKQFGAIAAVLLAHALLLWALRYSDVL